MDGGGAAYVAGYTTATNFTTTAGVIRPTHATSDGEGFVVKLNAAGTARDYSTYIGGSGEDVTRRIAVDSAGNAAVIGGTTSTNLVIVNGAQTSCGDSGCTLGDGFVLQINPTATAIRYSTYLGGTGIDDGIDLGLDFTGTTHTDSLFALGRIATLTSGVRTCSMADALGSVRRTVSVAGTVGCRQASGKGANCRPSIDLPQAHLCRRLFISCIVLLTIVCHHLHGEISTMQLLMLAAIVILLIGLGTHSLWDRFKRDDDYGI